MTTLTLSFLVFCSFCGALSAFYFLYFQEKSDISKKWLYTFHLRWTRCWNVLCLRSVMQGRTNFLWSFTRLSVSTDMRAIRKSHAFLSGLICPFNKFTVWTFKCHIRCVCVCAHVGGCLNATSGNEVISLLWGCRPQLHVGLLVVWEKASFSAGLSPSADWCREVAGPSVRPDLPLDGVWLLIPTPSHPKLCSRGGSI